MLRKSEDLLQRQAPDRVSQVEFLLGTEADLPPSAHFDVFITFFLLDLFTPPNLRLLLQRLQAVSQSNAVWLVTDFCPPRTWWQHLLLKVMYLFFRLTANINAKQLPPWPTELARLKLHRIAHEHFLGGMVEAAVFRKEPGLSDSN
jgi:hypothetical protein